MQIQIPKIFDLRQRARQQQRAAKHFASHDFLLREMQTRLIDRLDDTTRQFPQATLVDGRGIDLLSGHARVGNVMPAAFTTNEILSLDAASMDLALVPACLISMNDLPGALTQLCHALKPDGLLLAMVTGGRTLQELRDVLTSASVEITGGATPHLAPAIDVRDAGALLQRAGFALPVVDAEVLTVTYTDMFALMHDLRGMGEGNALIARRKHFSRRDVFLRAAELYTQRYCNAEGRITASFELVTLTAWAPHASQQQPAQRGSGTVSLKEALKP